MNIPGLEGGLPPLNPPKMHPPTSSPRLSAAPQGSMREAMWALQVCMVLLPISCQVPGVEVSVPIQGGAMPLFPELQAWCFWPCLAGWWAGEGWGLVGGPGAFRRGSGGDIPLPELLGFQDVASPSSQALLPWTWAASPGLMQANKILWLFTIFHPSSQDQQVPLRSLPNCTVPPTCPHCF